FGLLTEFCQDGQDPIVMRLERRQKVERVLALTGSEHSTRIVDGIPGVLFQFLKTSLFVQSRSCAPPEIERRLVSTVNEQHFIGRLYRGLVLPSFERLAGCPKTSRDGRLTFGLALDLSQLFPQAGECLVHEFVFRSEQLEPADGLLTSTRIEHPACRVD